MRIRAGLPTGVTALMFEEAVARRALEARLSGELLGRGFHEMLLPIMDYFDPYSDLLLPEVQGELYRFVDRDGQLLALRGDFTPMLARLLQAAPRRPRAAASGSIGAMSCATRRRARAVSVSTRSSEPSSSVRRAEKTTP